MSKERFVYIDALRGIAIAGVIIVHSASTVKLRGLAVVLANLGTKGVQLFFVISAFTIFYSLSKSIGSATQFRDFFIRRLFRIVPVYWFGIILYSLVYGLGSRGWKEGPELWHYPLHILLLNNLHPTANNSVVPGGWSISCEVLFYMAVPLLYVFLNTNKKLLGFLLLSLVLLPVLNLVLQNQAMTHWLTDMDKNEIREFFYRWLPGQLACFGFGILLFKVHADKRYVAYISNRKRNGLLTGLVLMVTFVLLKYKFPVPPAHHLYAFLFMCLALLLSVVPWKLFVNGFTVFLGKISYSCYLLHFLVVKQAAVFISTYFPVFAGHTKPYFLAVLVLTFLITIPLGWLSYTFLELRAVDWGRKLISYLNHTQTLEREHALRDKADIKNPL